VLLGPPGVGKGTQAQLLHQALGACHLSTGDLFRAARSQANPSPALQSALEAMRRGDLVSDSVVIAMVRERVCCIRCHEGFLLDGFPRNTTQAVALDLLLKDQRLTLDGVLCYELPLDEVVARLSGRRTCSGCKAVYHISTCPPRAPGICDQCRGQLVQRDDDRPEAIRVRMAAYEKSTRPLVEYYERAGKLITVQAVGTPEEILERTLHALEERDGARERWEGAKQCLTR
jgi:adenylate kinase